MIVCYSGNSKIHWRAGVVLASALECRHFQVSIKYEPGTYFCQDGKLFTAGEVLDTIVERANES